MLGFLTGCSVLIMFWGRERRGVFHWGCFWVPVLFRSFSSSLPLSSSSFSSRGRPGCPFLPSLGLPSGHRTDFRYLDRRERHVHVLSLLCLLSLPGSVAVSLPLSSPSFCPLYLSLFSLSFLHASVACSDMSECVGNETRDCID